MAEHKHAEAIIAWAKGAVYDGTTLKSVEML